MRKSDLTGGRLFPTTLPSRAEWLTFNARNTRIAAACREADDAVVVDLSTGQEVAHVTDGMPGDLEAFQFIGEDLLNVREGQVVRCNLKDGTHQIVFAEDGVYPQSVVIAPTGRLMAIGVSHGLILYDLVKKVVRQRLTSSIAGAPYRPAFSSRGRFVSADLIDDGGPSMMVVWDSRTGRRWWTIELESRQFFGATAIRDDTPIVAIADGGVDVYEPGEGADPVRRHDASGMSCAVQFRDLGATIATISYGGTLTLLRTSTGRVIRQVPPPAGHEIGTCFPSQDWSLLAGATSAGILIWPSGLV